MRLQSSPVLWHVLLATNALAAAPVSQGRLGIYDDILKPAVTRLLAAVWSLPQPPDATSPTAHASTQLTNHPPQSTYTRHSKDIVVRFNVSTDEEAKALAEASDTMLLDVWEFSRNWLDVRLNEELLPSLLGLLPSSMQHSHMPFLQKQDLAKAIYNTYPASKRAEDGQFDSSLTHRQSRSRLGTDSMSQNIFFEDYQPLSVIDPWLRLMANIFDSHVRLVNIGKSFEERDIMGLRVGVHPTNSEDPDASKRKTVLIVGGLHAREWVSTSTVNYLAYNFITNYGKDVAVTRLLEEFDFVFIPTINPDGYAYTWETDRLWRKNRQQTSVRFCSGIDLDRNFGFEWSGASTQGNPCSESFAGENAFEAVESRRLANWAKNETERNNVEFVTFLDLHSYSQEILYPYSFSCDVSPPGEENLEELGYGLAKAIRISSGYRYEVMPACEGNIALSTPGKKQVLYPRIEEAGGSALDWFYSELHVHYAYQIKLRDRGTYGFLLPRENIVPTGRETLDALLYLGSFLQETFATGESPRSGTGPGPQVNEGKVAGGDYEPNWDLKRRRRR